MRSVIACVWSVLAITGCSGGDAGGAFADDAPAGPQAAARGPPAGAIHVERAVIVDAAGFEAPMAASTLFLPRGWQTRGGVFWGQQFMCTNGYNVDWSATSPDGSMSVAVLPQHRWETNNYGAPPSTPGCPAAPHVNVRQYLESLAQHFRRGARPLDYRPREDLEREFAHLNTAMPSAMGEMRTWVEAGEIAIEFEESGAARQGLIVAAVIFSLTRTSTGPGFPVMDALTGFALPAYAVTAPKGRLDTALFEAIRRSMKPNPQWEARIAGHNAAIGRVAIEEARKRSEAITRSNAEIARIREEAWSAYQESADRRAREFGELIRGVETYDDPKAATGQVELSGQYHHAWRLNDGSYVLTNDPNFDPWRDLQIEGDRLQATR